MLKCYNFDAFKQKKAIEYIFHEAGIFKQFESWDQHFPTSSNCDDLAKNILKLVQQTQKHFVIRSGDQERWEVQSGEWINDDNKQKIISAFKSLGFHNAVKPKKIRNSDAICILGSVLSSMKYRIQFAKDLLDNKIISTKNVILLAGQRSVSIGVDGDKDELLDIAKKYSIDDLDKLTETHLIQEAYNTSYMESELNVHVIDTPAGDLPRPTTQTTIIELFNWLKTHKCIKSLIFISDQPHVKYQEAIIEQVLKSVKCDDINYEVVGPAVAPHNDLHNMAESLGSYLWAKTPSVLSKLNFENQKLKAQFNDLYRDQPLIFK